MKDKLSIVGGILTIAGLICEFAKTMLDDRKQEQMIEEKVNKKFEEKEEKKGS